MPAFQPDNLTLASFPRIPRTCTANSELSGWNFCHPSLSPCRLAAVFLVDFWEKK